MRKLLISVKIAILLFFIIIFGNLNKQPQKVPKEKPQFIWNNTIP